MKNKSCAATWIISRMLITAGVVALTACARSGGDAMEYTGPVSTPTVDYVESLDVYSAPHKDSFLNQLAMNYRSYAIYNARTSGYADMGELFANKAVAAFSGETPFPESLNNWPVDDEQTEFELNNAYNELLEQLKNDATYTNPELAAEAQAKFDCWLSATASGQIATANQCRDRFNKTITALRDCRGGKIVQKTTQTTAQDTVVETNGDMIVETTTTQRSAGTYYPDTRNMATMRGAGNAREGVIIVNNVSVPEHLIKPEPVQPMVFNQNIYGGDKTITKSATDNSIRNSHNSRCAQQQVPDGICQQQPIILSCPQNQPDCPRQECPDIDCPEQPATPLAIVINEKEQPVPTCPECQKCQNCPDCNVSVDCSACEKCEPIPIISDELVTRDEFINMMMAMRAELAAINTRLDQIQAAQGEKTMIKVQQIPLEPKQHVMEEVFEIRFDFNKATIKPEYKELIEKLASATQENKNIKVSVVGHTDTSGTTNYNYALGGRRAEAVQKMLIQYGIPASQIVAVSAGEEDLAVPTPDNTPNAENRRVRVVKEVHYTEPAQPAPVAIQVEEVSIDGTCGEYGCEE